MPTVYFVKHGVSRPIYDGSRRPIPFEDVGDDTGLLQLDEGAHPNLIKELTRISGSLGVARITSEQAEEIKKNCNVLRQAKLLRASQRPDIRIESSQHDLKRVAAADAVSAPLVVPESIPPPVKPRAKRANRIATGDLAPQPQAAAPTEPVPA
jgi:hypothetical protein